VTPKPEQVVVTELCLFTHKPSPEEEHTKFRYCGDLVTFALALHLLKFWELVMMLSPNTHSLYNKAKL
jgi:hypothetical protein